jgi:hypothetical protein
VRPRSSLIRPSSTLLVAAALVATLGACSSSSNPSVGASTESPGAAAPSTPASAAASASSAPTGAAGASFSLLPESVLASMTPLVYTSDPKADMAMAASGAQATVNAVFDGGISRTLAYQGKTVGGVEVYRFNATVPASGRAQFVPIMVQSFAQKAPIPSTLGTTPVQVADQARNTAITVVGWTHGEEIIIIWASGIPATQQIAQQYMAQSA